MRRRLCGLVLCLLAHDAGAETAVPFADTCRAGSHRLAQVELYFGAPHTVASRHHAAWTTFLATVVTPRFPDGFTVLNAAGQWRGPNGIRRETSHVMIIVYRPDRQSDENIEAIRSTYKSRFKQQSVLRVDTSVCAAF